jgi:hypothetical protein
MPMAGGGTTTGNIDMASPIQAPGMGEAVARMQAGETPVRASTGLDVNLNRINVPTTNLNAIGGITSRQPIQMDLPNLGGLSMPPLQSMDQNRIRAYSDEYMNIMRPYLNQMTGGAGPNIQETMEILEPYLPKQRSSAEILKEYQDLLGTGDEDAAKTQAYLALVKAGQSIAGSDKTLLGAAIDAAGEIAPDLSKIAAQKDKQERATKLAARQEATQREEKP